MPRSADRRLAARLALLIAVSVPAACTSPTSAPNSSPAATTAAAGAADPRASSAPSVAPSVAPTPSPTPSSPPPPATLVPVPSDETRAAAAGWLEGRGWRAQHDDCVALARSEPLDVVFLGDSITQSWGGPGRRVGAPAAEVWERWYGARRAAAFGISGDRTQHLLWRLGHGLAEALAPRIAVLHVGTNNVPHDAPADIALGIAACAQALCALPSEPRVVVVLPFRGLAPDSTDRAAVRAIAGALDGLAAHERIDVLDLGARLSLLDGRYDPALVGGDGVHLKPAGYEVWARALEPFVALALAIPYRADAQDP